MRLLNATMQFHIRTNKTRLKTIRALTCVRLHAEASPPSIKHKRDHAWRELVQRSTAQPRPFFSLSSHCYFDNATNFCWIDCITVCAPICASPQHPWLKENQPANFSRACFHVEHGNPDRTVNGAGLKTNAYKNTRQRHILFSIDRLFHHNQSIC